MANRTRIRAVAAEANALRSLHVELDRHRARAGRAWRKYRTCDETVDPVSAANLHKAWSDAIADGLRAAEAVSREQPDGLGDLLAQFEAIWWWIGEDDNVLDGSTRRWLARFRRHLRALATET